MPINCGVLLSTEELTVKPHNWDNFNGKNLCFCNLPWEKEQRDCGTEALPISTVIFPVTLLQLKNCVESVSNYHFYYYYFLIDDI